MQSYQAGQPIQCGATWYRNDTAAVVTPTTVHFVLTTVDDGSNVLRYTFGTDPQLKSDGAGGFLVDIDSTALAGEYLYRFWSPASDPWPGTSTGTFRVDTAGEIM